MPPSLPANLQKYGLRAILVALTTIALSFGLARYALVRPFALPAFVTLFWLAMFVLTVSDSLDDRPVNDRGWLSFCLNALGTIGVALSAIAALGWLLFNLLFAVGLN